jgi:hypothetical protein
MLGFAEEIERLREGMKPVSIAWMSLLITFGTSTWYMHNRLR